MSINSGFSIGRSSLLASQVGLQVAGNNIANANSVGFSRQRMDLTPMRDQVYGRLRLGTGVDTQAIRRITDRALQQRTWNATANQAAADTTRQQLESLESLLNALGDTDTTSPELNGPSLSSQMASYFGAWSTLSTRPGDAAARATVVQQGQRLADYFRSTRAQVVQQQGSIDNDLSASIQRANTLMQQIADINGQVLSGGSSSSSGLLDRRDQLITELSTLAEVTVNEQPSGSADILIGSTPLVIGGGYSPMSLRTRTQDGQSVTEIVSGENNDVLNIASGRLGALLSAKRNGYQAVINQIDTLAAQVIFQTNRAYSIGSSGTPRSSFSATRSVAEPALSFNNPANSTFSSLRFGPTSGQVVVEVVTNGSRQRTTIPIDLDGLNSVGAAGYGDDTSLNSLMAQFNGIANLTATVDVNGMLQISAASGSTVSIVEDTSGIMASLGVNSFFTGSSAADMDMNASLVAEPLSLNTSTVNGTDTNDNGIAMAMAALRDTKLVALGGASMGDFWNSATQTVASATNNAKTQTQAATAIKDSLEGQMAALTGVNLDEEAINLVQYQTMYQASARYINVLQEVTRTLLELA